MSRDCSLIGGKSTPAATESDDVLTEYNKKIAKPRAAWVR